MLPARSRSEQARNPWQGSAWGFHLFDFCRHCSRIERFHRGTMRTSYHRLHISGAHLSVTNNPGLQENHLSSTAKIHLDQQRMGISGGQSFSDLDCCFRFWLWSKETGKSPCGSWLSCLYWVNINEWISSCSQAGWNVLKRYTNWLSSRAPAARSL